MNKKHIAAILFITLMVLVVGVGATDTMIATITDYKVYVNGVNTDLGMVEIDGHYCAPVKRVAQELGLRASVNDKNKSVDIYTIRMPLEITKYNFDKLVLIADDEEMTFLGNLKVDAYDKNSIFNQYGTYGSELNAKSIFNTYGRYGGQIGKYSPFNKLSANPPKIVDRDHNYYGRLTNNSNYLDGITFDTIMNIIKERE